MENQCKHGMMKQVGEMNPETGDIEHKCMICSHPQVFKWHAYPRINYIGLDESIDAADNTE